jgi:hypothetical protein
MSNERVRHSADRLDRGAEAPVRIPARPWWWRTIVLLAVIFGAPLAACGGKGGSPAGPGTTPAQTVQPAWTSDNTTVLSIDVTGLARGLTNGAATITATHGGVSETRRMRVVTDYQGSWTGDYVVRRCDHTGDFRSGEFCDREEGFWAGDRLPIALTLTQERDAVTGPFTLGGIAGTLAGTVDGSGQLTATAGLTLTVDGNVVTFNVPSFAARADGERLSGAFTVDVTAASLAGNGHLEAELQSVTRAAAVMAPAGDAGSSSFGSWRELLQVIKRRR